MALKAGEFPQGKKQKMMSEAAEVAEMHWETVQQWRIDTDKGHKQSRSGLTARMAAAGIKPGSDNWDAQMKEADRLLEEEYGDINSGATMNILNRYVKDMKKLRIKTHEMQAFRAGQPIIDSSKRHQSGEVYKAPAPLPDGYETMGTEEYMAKYFPKVEMAPTGSQFALDKAATTDAASQQANSASSQANAKKRAGGAVADPTGSPWWK